MSQQALFARRAHPRANKGDFPIVRDAEIGQRFTLAFPDVPGAPRRRWMHEPVEVVVTALATEDRGGLWSPVFETKWTGYGVEVDIPSRGLRGTLTMRPEIARFRQLLHLYSNDDLGGHTTGHPFRLT